MLDSEEYFHLAVNATQKGEHHSALEYLHNALEKDPNNAKAKYLLGAEYAELGLFERAIREMEDSLSLDPSIDMATFQLAMLYIKFEKAEEASQKIQHLIENSGDQTLIEFAKGLQFINEDNKDNAITQIESALQLDTPNQALKDSMQNVLTFLKNFEEKSSDTEITASNDAEENTDESNQDNTAFLKVYNNTSFKDDDE